MINEEEKYDDDDEASNDEQGTSVESQVLTTDLRHSQCERKPFKHFGHQNIYEQWLYWFVTVLKSGKGGDVML